VPLSSADVEKAGGLFTKRRLVTGSQRVMPLSGVLLFRLWRRSWNEGWRKNLLTEL
jgi:hypothetical protein